MVFAALGTGLTFGTPEGDVVAGTQVQQTFYVQVGNDGDDDFFGLVVGFQPGDLASAHADCLLIDWKKGTQGATRAGLSPSRGTGVSRLDEFRVRSDDDPNDGAGRTQLATGEVSGAVGQGL